MKAPDIIYTDGKNTCAPAPVFSNADGNIKYIRADLTELSWEDIAVIDSIILDTNNELAVDYSKEISRQKFYEEVLTRFKEQRKK